MNIHKRRLVNKDRRRQKFRLDVLERLSWLTGRLSLLLFLRWLRDNRYHLHKRILCGPTAGRAKGLWEQRKTGFKDIGQSKGKGYGERPQKRDPRSRLSLILNQKRMDLPQEKANRTFSTSKAGREVSICFGRDLSVDRITYLVQSPRPQPEHALIGQGGTTHQRQTKVRREAKKRVSDQTKTFILVAKSPKRVGFTPTRENKRPATDSRSQFPGLVGQAVSPPECKPEAIAPKKEGIVI